jgi:hypothetical protein
MLGVGGGVMYFLRVFFLGKVTFPIFQNRILVTISGKNHIYVSGYKGVDKIFREHTLGRRMMGQTFFTLENNEVVSFWLLKSWGG